MNSEQCPISYKEYIKTRTNTCPLDTLDLDTLDLDTLDTVSGTSDVDWLLDLHLVENYSLIVSRHQI